MLLADPGCLDRLAEVLELQWQPAPFNLHGETVYQASMTNRKHGINLRLVVWCSLARIDAYLGNSFTVFKGVDDIQILPGVEAIFKRGARDYMLVTRDGQVASSTGDLVRQ